MNSGGLIRSLLSHIKCRNIDYPNKNGKKIERFPVPDDKVSWNTEWIEYSPQEYTAIHAKGKSWSDPDINDPNFNPSWNKLDGNINRCSHMGEYNILNGYPLNPIGRTGLKGRGILGRWGPNHAADPIVTKWKRDKNNSIIYDDESKKPILQFIAIKRKDCNEWAIPGGMVDPGEIVSQTLKREFFEEALNFIEMNDNEKVNITNYLNKFFSKGTEVYRGYVDDIRNTDNSWMETVAQNFHDEDGSLLEKLCLKAGDDAKDVVWTDISKNLQLYASHSDFIKLVVEKHNSHW
ncbi:hypothetical protein O3M35_003168 [Rhynocoris fuscipes]|uniref:Nudix hydrolase domain-containing protein n=1 Tax=Rhynocoris fuscipes TaxID=488301 RepID=A0AAW1CPZ1_9HEMI